eukprot:1158069-Pelagomonas_calceolata.AAC.2
MAEVKGREGKGCIAVPACGGSLAEAKRAEVKDWAPSSNFEEPNHEAPQLPRRRHRLAGTSVYLRADARQHSAPSNPGSRPYFH